METLLTAQGLADVLKCRREQIYRLLSTDKRIPYILVGKRKRFIPERVIAHLERHSKSTLAQKRMTA